MVRERMAWLRHVTALAVASQAKQAQRITISSLVPPRNGTVLTLLFALVDSGEDLSSLLSQR